MSRLVRAPAGSDLVPPDPAPVHDRHVGLQPRPHDVGHEVADVRLARPERRVARVQRHPGLADPHVERLARVGPGSGRPARPSPAPPASSGVMGTKRCWRASTLPSGVTWRSMRTTKTPSDPAFVISVSPTTFSSGSCSWPPMTRWMPGTARAICSSAGMSWCVTATTIGRRPVRISATAARAAAMGSRNSTPGPGLDVCGVSATVRPKNPTCDPAALDDVRRAGVSEQPARRAVPHVRRQPDESGLPHPREQRRRSEVELVVPERGDVEPELVPGGDHLLAPEHRRHDRTARSCRRPGRASCAATPPGSGRPGSRCAPSRPSGPRDRRAPGGSGR